LSPIPEGQVDSSIPSPVWPCCEACILSIQRPHNGSTDPHNFIHNFTQTFSKSSKFRIQFLHELSEDHPRHEYHRSWEECLNIQVEKRSSDDQSTSGSSGKYQNRARRRGSRSQLSQEVLHDLAVFLSEMMSEKPSLSPQDILNAITESLQRSLIQQNAIKGVCCQKEDNYSTSSSSGCKDLYVGSSSSSIGSLADRVARYRTQKEEEVYHGDVEKSSGSEGHHHHRDLSSSSMDSTSSFSPSTAHEELYSVPGITGHGIVCEVKSARSSNCGSSDYEKLISAKRKVSDFEKGCDEEPKEEPPPGGKVTTVLQKVEHPYYVSSLQFHY